MNLSDICILSIKNIITRISQSEAIKLLKNIEWTGGKYQEQF